MTATARFAVEPREALSGDEQQLLARLAVLDSSHVLGSSEPFRVRIVSAPAWPAPDRSRLPDFAPARLEVVGGRIRVLHRRYLAELDPAAGTGWLYRANGPAGLSVVLRLAESCRLPLLGGLPLHAAGVVLDGSGLAFFGPSGAGKSTLAASFEGTPLSDELVALAGAPFRLWGTGFWGTFEGEKRSVDSAPLAALVALDKGAGFALERLDAAIARRLLVGAILIPLETRLWSAALAVVGRLVREVPVYRMTWSPKAPPWAELRRMLKGDLPRRSRS